LPFYLVDTNGPNKGQNVQGRDVFNLSGRGYFCAGSLLEKRKMNY